MHQKEKKTHKIVIYTDLPATPSANSDRTSDEMVRQACLLSRADRTDLDARVVSVTITKRSTSAGVRFMCTMQDFLNP